MASWVVSSGSHGSSSLLRNLLGTTFPSGKLKLAVTSLDVISASPKNFLTSRIDFTVLLLFEFLQKNITCLLGKLKTELTSYSPIAKSTSPRLSDITFFARCQGTLLPLLIIFIYCCSVVKEQRNVIYGTYKIF